MLLSIFNKIKSILFPNKLVNTYFLTNVDELYLKESNEFTLKKINESRFKDLIKYFSISYNYNCIFYAYEKRMIPSFYLNHEVFSRIKDAERKERTNDKFRNAFSINYFNYRYMANHLSLRILDDLDMKENESDIKQLIRESRLGIKNILLKDYTLVPSLHMTNDNLKISKDSYTFSDDFEILSEFYDENKYSDFDYHYKRLKSLTKKDDIQHELMNIDEVNDFTTRMTYYNHSLFLGKLEHHDFVKTKAIISLTELIINNSQLNKDELTELKTKLIRHFKGRFSKEVLDYVLSNQDHIKSVMSKNLTLDEKYGSYDITFTFISVKGNPHFLLIELVHHYINVIEQIDASLNAL